MPGMQIPSDHPLLLRIVDDLAEHGWSQQELFVPQGLTMALAAECRTRHAQGELAPAAVGRGPSQEIREGIRGDRIQWIEPGEAAPCDRYLEVMDSLREALNRGRSWAWKISNATLPCTRLAACTCAIWIAFATMTAAWFPRCCI
jgi:SM-20-related protein